MKRCQDHRPLLAAEVGGELGPHEAEELRSHLGGCPACRQELDEYKYVIQLARASFDEVELPGYLRARIAAGARETVLERRFWQGWLMSPLRPALAGITAVAALLLVGYIVVRPGPSPRPSSSREPVRLEMQLEEGGKVRLAWKDGRQGVYTVRKSADPRGLASAETHLVRGNTWVDDAPASSPVVYYQVN